MPLPLIKRRCGWCHQRPDTVIDKLVERWSWFYKWIVRPVDKVTRRPAIWWHRRFH